jgi:hypothetical protein
MFIPTIYQQKINLEPNTNIKLILKFLKNTQYLVLGIKATPFPPIKTNLVCLQKLILVQPYIDLGAIQVVNLIKYIDDNKEIQ